jgi:hypothetical protein
MWEWDQILTLKEEKALEPLIRELRALDKPQGNP